MKISLMFMVNIWLPTYSGWNEGCYAAAVSALSAWVPLNLQWGHFIWQPQQLVSFQCQRCCCLLLPPHRSNPNHQLLLESAKLKESIKQVWKVIFLLVWLNDRWISVGAEEELSSQYLLTSLNSNPYLRELLIYFAEFFRFDKSILCRRLQNKQTIFIYIWHVESKTTTAI